ncbi:MAG TPA: hypothetical protein VIR30_05510 [Nocardioides sp.]
MADVSWMALALALSVCGALWTWYAWRNRGTGSALRGAALTLLPIAAWLTGTLEMFGEIAASVSDWAVGFVFSPGVWLGIALFVLSVLLFGVSTRLSGRKEPAVSPDSADSPVSAPKAKRSVAPSAGKRTPAIDDDLADIEAILRSRGIS